MRLCFVCGGRLRRTLDWHRTAENIVACGARLTYVIRLVHSFFLRLARPRLRLTLPRVLNASMCGLRLLIVFMPSSVGARSIATDVPAPVSCLCARAPARLSAHDSRSDLPSTRSISSHGYFRFAAAQVIGQSPAVHRRPANPDSSGKYSMLSAAAMIIFSDEICKTIPRLSLFRSKKPRFTPSHWAWRVRKFIPRYAPPA
jgi:hypothetical protein